MECDLSWDSEDQRNLYLPSQRFEFFIKRTSKVGLILQFTIQSEYEFSNGSCQSFKLGAAVVNLSLL
jgi:hypothetical protein